MHLAEVYATSTGSKIDKPFIFEQFFPLVFDNYITLQGQTKYESKDYDYWQDVINIISPVFEKLGIKIIQVGGANELPYQNVIDLRGRTDLQQLAYVIKNAKLHVGSDSLGTHLASSYDIPLIGLYSVSQSTISGPYFGTKEKQILFDAYLRTRTGKPSYSDKENPKCVNLIMPEEIADAIFKLIGLKAKTPFKTVFIGSKYSSRVIREFIPSTSTPILNPESPIEIRMDIHFDEKVLAEQLNMCKAVIVTNKKINKTILHQFKSNIAALIYIIEENDEPQFIADVKDLGFPIVLLSRLTEEQIQPKKINYYEHGKINIIEPEQKEKWETIKKDFDKIYYRSTKLVSKDGKIFNNIVGLIKNEESISDLDYYKAIDVPEFWQELPFMTLVEIDS
jgi:hypothetical protein